MCPKLTGTAARVYFQLLSPHIRDKGRHALRTRRLDAVQPLCPTELTHAPATQHDTVYTITVPEVDRFVNCQSPESLIQALIKDFKKGNFYHMDRQHKTPNPTRLLPLLSRKCLAVFLCSRYQSLPHWANVQNLPGRAINSSPCRRDTIQTCYNDTHMVA